MSIKYTQSQKNEILSFLSNNNYKKTQIKYKIGYTTLKSWQDPQFHKRQKEYLKQDYVDHNRKEYHRQFNNKPTTRSILNKDHLTYSYSNTECSAELDKIIHKNGNFGPIIALNKIVLTHQPHYYEIENKIWKENKDNFRYKLVKNRQKHIGKVCDEFTLTEKEMLRGFKISGKHIGYSHFNPLWIKAFIDKYNIRSIYDPCMGWGHRLLGSYHIDYIGNDWDRRTFLGCKEIANKYNIPSTILYNEDCRYFTPPQKYECVFTCFPYYNTEIYNNKTFKDIDDFNSFIHLAFKSAIKEDTKIIGMVINHAYAANIKNIAAKHGLNHIEDIPLGLKYNHFQRNSQTIKKEMLIVFDK